jgi:hypothetical protein
MEFFSFRIHRLKIGNNREFGEGEMKLLSFVTAGDSPPPVLDGLLQTTDPKEKERIIQAASREVLATREFVRVDHIEDGQAMTFGRTGYALYSSPRIPQSFDWTFLVMESDEDINALGNRIDAILSGPEFDGFTKNVLTELSVSPTPQVKAALSIGKFLSRAITGALTRNLDDQVGVYYLSFDRMEDYPDGARHDKNVPDLSGNVRVEYSIFAVKDDAG